MFTSISQEAMKQRVAFASKVSDLRGAEKKLHEAQEAVRNAMGGLFNSPLPGVADATRRALPQFDAAARDASSNAREAHARAETVVTAIALAPQFDQRQAFTTRAHEEPPAFAQAAEAAAHASGAGA